MPLLKPPEPQIATRKFFVRIEEPWRWIWSVMPSSSAPAPTPRSCCEKNLPDYAVYARRVPTRLLPATQAFRSTYAQHKR